MRRRKIASCITSFILAGTMLMTSACSAGGAVSGETGAEDSPEETAEVTETELPSVDMSEVTVEPVPDQIYSGEPIYVSAVLNCDVRPLTEGVDYWLDNYSNNVNIGTVTCDVVGNGTSLTGRTTISFDIITGDDVCDSEENAGLIAFVDRLYVHLLGRYPGLTEMTDNVRRLRSGSRSGIEMINIIIQSPEFQARGLSDTDFLTCFYLGVLNRNVDEGGLNYNLGLLSGGMSRLDLVNGIICSEEGEFASICNSLGITLGNGHDIGAVPQIDDGVPTSSFNYTVDGRNVTVHRRVYQFVRANDDGSRYFDLDALCAASGYSPVSADGSFIYSTGVYELTVTGSSMTLTVGGDEVSYYEDFIDEGEETFSVNGTDTTVSIGMLIMIEYSLENVE